MAKRYSLQASVFLTVVMFTSIQTSFSAWHECHTSDHSICNCSWKGLKTIDMVFSKENNRHNCETFDFSNNNITTIWRSTFGSVNSISVLLLNNNKIRKIEPNSFSAMTNLITLELSGNMLDGTTTDAKQFNFLDKLKRLKMNRNPLHVIKTFTFHFMTFPALVYLELSHCQIRQLEDGAISLLKLLEYLDLSWNKLKTFRRHDLKGLKSLKTLDLSHNYLKVLNEMPILGALIDLYLDSNKIYQVSVRKDILNGTDMLEHLYVRNNNIKLFTEDGFPWSLESLEGIYLDGNPIQCDCNMRWVINNEDFQGRNFAIPCHSPREHKGKNLLTIPGDKLTCRIPIFEIGFLVVVALAILLAFITSVYLTVKRNAERRRVLQISKKYMGANFTAVYTRSGDSPGARLVSPIYARLENEEGQEFDV